MAISKRQYLPILIFGLLPKLSDVLQKQVLLFLINCVNVRVFCPCLTIGANAQRGDFLRDGHSAEVHFHADVAAQIQRFRRAEPLRDPVLLHPTLRRLHQDHIRLHLHFGIPRFRMRAVSCRTFVRRTLKRFFSPSDWARSRAKPTKTNPGLRWFAWLTCSVFRSGDYLGTLLRISQSSTSPPSFFSWNQPATGIVATPTSAWPKNGFAFFAWVCVESFAQSGSRVPLFDWSGIVR